MQGKLNYFVMSIAWDVKWCPVVRITIPLARQRPFLWISWKSRLVRAARKTSNFITYNSLIVAAVTWLEYYRYGVNPKQSIIYFVNDISVYIYEKGQVTSNATCCTCLNCLFVWLVGCLVVWCFSSNFSLKGRRHCYWWRSANFDLYSALMAIM